MFIGARFRPYLQHPEEQGTLIRQLITALNFAMTSSQ